MDEILRYEKTMYEINARQKMRDKKVYTKK